MKRKSVSAMLIGMLAAVICAGCGDVANETQNGQTDASGASSGAEESGDESGSDGGGVDEEEKEEEMYHAVMAYMVAQDSQDQNMISERFNELTREQLNMEVELLPMTYSTQGSQLPMMLAGGEQLDLFTAPASFSSTYIESEYIENLAPYTDAIPYITELLGEEAMACCSVGDFLYGIPTMKERCTPCGVVMRTDCLQAAGIDADSIKTYADLTDVFAKVQELYPEMIMFGGSGSVNGMGMSATPAGQSYWYDGLGQNVGTGVLEDYGQTTTVTNYYESDYFKENSKLAREWYLAGYIAKDMPTCTDSGEVLMKAGNLFSYLTLVKPDTKQEKDDQTGYDTTVVQMEDDLLTTATMSSVVYYVGSSSPNPEKALELLNWISKTKEANDLLNWGIEGVHWVEKEDGTADYPEGVTAESCGYHQNMGFMHPNQFNSHVWTGNDPDKFVQYQEVYERATVSRAFGFSPDLSGLVDEIAATANVIEQYLGQITTGAVDPESAIREFNEALYKAGIQDIIDAKQEQLDEWIAQQ